MYPDILHTSSRTWCGVNVIRAKLLTGRPDVPHVTPVLVTDHHKSDPTRLHVHDRSVGPFETGQTDTTRTSRDGHGVVTTRETHRHAGRHKRVDLTGLTCVYTHVRRHEPTHVC